MAGDLKRRPNFLRSDLYLSFTSVQLGLEQAHMPCTCRRNICERKVGSGFSNADGPADDSSSLAATNRAGSASGGGSPPKIVLARVGRGTGRVTLIKSPVIGSRARDLPAIAQAVAIASRGDIDSKRLSAAALA